MRTSDRNLLRTLVPPLLALCVVAVITRPIATDVTCVVPAPSSATVAVAPAPLATTPH